MQSPNSEQIQQVITIEETREALTFLAAKVNNPLLGIEINPRDIFCQKTGYKIATRDENSLFSVMKIHGKSEFVESLFSTVSLNVHPAWVQTDGESLDYLIDKDPVGYCVYCFSIMTARFYKAPHIKKQDERNAMIERHWALARANALISSRAIGELAELNQALGVLLTYAPATNDYIYRALGSKLATQPDMLALLACSGELLPMLKKATDYALDQIGRGARHIRSGMTQMYMPETMRYVSIPATAADAMRGPSQIRTQKKTKRNANEAAMMHGFEAMFASAGISLGKTIIPGKPLDISRFYKNVDNKKETEIENEYLEALGDLDLGDFPLDNENEVEIRVIPREEYAPVNMPTGCEDGRDTTSENATLQNHQGENESANITNAMQNIAAEIRTEMKVAEITPIKKMSAIEMLRAKKVQK